MTIDRLHLGQAHNVFSPYKGYTGKVAKKNDKWHYDVVRGCIKSLKKYDFARCSNEEQLEDIKKAIKFEIEAIYVENEFIIRRK